MAVRASENYSNVFSFLFFVFFLSFPFRRVRLVFLSPYALSFYLSRNPYCESTFSIYGFYIYSCLEMRDTVVVEYHHVTSDTRRSLIGFWDARRLDRVHVEVVGPATMTSCLPNTSLCLVWDGDCVFFFFLGVGVRDSVFLIF